MFLIIVIPIINYHKPVYQKILIEKAGNCLANGGYLIVAERGILMKLNYDEVFPQSGLFQKRDATVQKTASTKAGIQNETI